MTTETTPAITVVTSTEVPVKFRKPGDPLRKLAEEGIPLDRLQESYTRFLEGMRAIFDGHEGRIGDFVLEEITFSAEIGASGEFKLLGTGAGISANSGVTFTLRRQPGKEKETEKED